jgi:hypothetical protein
MRRKDVILGGLWAAGVYGARRTRGVGCGGKTGQQGRMNGDEVLGWIGKDTSWR